jgi:hypothetical protein
MKKLFLALLLLAVPPALFAVSLAWDPNPTQDQVTGYNVYQDMGAGAPVKVGTTTATTFPLTVVPGVRLFFVTAFNATGESNPSNEVQVFGPAHPPTNVHIQ